ncbi:hypothetical protein ACFL3B_01915 [Gemmatimonadota bacterium]
MSLGIPPGHLPGPGECRVWVQGTPPGLQARARSCNGILATAPVGSWILYRPAQYQRQVRVRYLHANQQMVIAVRAFDSETGAYLHDFALDEDDNNMGPLVAGGNRPTVRGNGQPNGSRGNSDNAPGRIGTARDGGTSTGNNGVAAGRADTVKSHPSAGGNRGNLGTDNRTANGANKRSDQAPDNTVTAIDPTSGSIVAGDSGNSASQTDRSGVRRATDRTVRGGAVAGRDEATTEERPDNPSKVRADRRGEPEDTSEDSELPASLGIHARYFPTVGQCRVWVPGERLGRQARPTRCDGIAEDAPPGSWILRRSNDQPDVILVDYMDDENPGVVVRTSAFDAATGAAVRAVQLD